MLLLILIHVLFAPFPSVIVLSSSFRSNLYSQMHVRMYLFFAFLSTTRTHTYTHTHAHRHKFGIEKFNPIVQLQGNGSVGSDTK